MAIKTYTEQLEEVQVAISEVLADGQSSKYGDQEMISAKLETLYTAEARLLRKVSQQARKEAGKSTRTRSFRLTQR